ncbi:MAG: hypothetical protein A3F73_12125 [Gallionellales bacterium RIFCSPLOWO2_12_FULL_59_22]|nr:MAG: hypothetical protein A3H99_01430 [Gallionellales bacterium RIFCSPLOWO2_02_FULL_59_110]OGT12210.1 MAG: hypothetical protein A3F73_12125 [Gallionellales bacterium RIFCSPLOWO2_12_FULL_59_22]
MLLSCGRRARGIAFFVICALLLPPAFADEGGRAKWIPPPPPTDWSPARPPPGYSADAYSPDKVKPDFAPDVDPAAGINHAYDPNADPLHPTKNPDVDPGPGWDRTPDGVRRPADQSPGVSASTADWEWGERYYDSQFDATLVITNNCKSWQPVSIFIFDLPFLTLPSHLTVPPGSTSVIGKVKLPPEPPPPMRLGLPGEPGWGHVDYGKALGPNPVFTFPPPKLHQPNFVKIEGRVVAWHPWSPPDCNPRRETYNVSGHIHFRPPPPEGDGGPEKIASPGVCQVYWNIGVPPAQLKDEDCTAEMRELARAFRERVLPSYIFNSPEDWLWLPDGKAIGAMQIQDLLAMKARASAIMGRPY